MCYIQHENQKTDYRWLLSRDIFDVGYFVAGLSDGSFVAGYYLSDQITCHVHLFPSLKISFT